MLMLPPEADWSTAVPDWRERIREGRSLLPALPLHEEVAAKALRNFKRLRVPDMEGTPTYGEVCGEWIFDIVRAIFGAFDPVTKRRMLREFFLLVPKGNGKTALAGAIMVTALIGNARPRAEALMIAPRIKVADIAFQQAAGIIALDPELRELFQAQDHLRKITHRTTRAFLQIKAADKEGVTGSKATFILIDETHELSSNSKADAILLELRGSLGKRPDGFLLQITTQSKKPPAGVFKAELTRARSVRDGKLIMPMLPVLYELPIEDSIDGGWKNPRTWPLVNPNLGRSVDPIFLADELRSAEQEGPEKLALIASQHFNVEVGLGLNADAWPGALHWPAAKRPGLTLEAMLKVADVCTIGVDWGGADDLAALVVIARHRETREWLLWCRAWARPTVFERRKEIASRLADFVKDGDLRLVADGDTQAAEAAEICEQVRDAGLLPEKDGIGLDVAGISLLQDALQARGMVAPLVCAVPQDYRLQPSHQTIALKLESGRMWHCGQPLMSWAVGNAKQQLVRSNYQITKEFSGSAKIDPVFAAFDASFLMLRNPQPARKPEYQLIIV